MSVGPLENNLFTPCFDFHYVECVSKIFLAFIKHFSKIFKNLGRDRIAAYTFSLNLKM